MLFAMLLGEICYINFLPGPLEHPEKESCFLKKNSWTLDLGNSECVPKAINSSCFKGMVISGDFRAPAGSTWTVLGAPCNSAASRSRCACWLPVLSVLWKMTAKSCLKLLKRRTCKHQNHWQFVASFKKNTKRWWLQSDLDRTSLHHTVPVGLWQHYQYWLKQGFSSRITCSQHTSTNYPSWNLFWGYNFKGHLVFHIAWI